MSSQVPPPGSGVGQPPPAAAAAQSSPVAPSSAVAAASAALTAQPLSPPASVQGRASDQTVAGIAASTDQAASSAIAQAQTQPPPPPKKPHPFALAAKEAAEKINEVEQALKTLQADFVRGKYEQAISAAKEATEAADALRQQTENVIQNIPDFGSSLNSEAKAAISRQSGQMIPAMERLMHKTGTAILNSKAILHTLQDPSKQLSTDDAFQRLLNVYQGLSQGRQDLQTAIGLMYGESVQLLYKLEISAEASSSPQPSGTAAGGGSSGSGPTNPPSITLWGRVSRMIIGTSAFIGLRVAYQILQVGYSGTLPSCSLHLNRIVIVLTQKEIPLNIFARVFGVFISVALVDGILFGGDISKRAYALASRLSRVFDKKD